MLRQTVRSLASSPPAAWLLTVLERLDRGRHDGLAVLMYHRIAEPPPSAVSTSLYVTPSALADHMDALSRRYTMVGLDDVLLARHGRRPLPRRALLLTFDDAYLDFEANAWPVLRERSLPAVLFVPTGYPDQPQRWFWWDRLGEVLSGPMPAPTIFTSAGELAVSTFQDRQRAYRLLRERAKRLELAAATRMVEELATTLDAPPARNDVLGWASLRRLADEGLAVAPHSRSHALLPTLTDDQLDEELHGSRTDLERELGGSNTTFAYPSGAYDQRVVRAVERAGYEVALTTRRGVNALRNGKWLELLRVNVGHEANSTLLRAQVGSWMTVRPDR
jgi:peptidoglycan/xylan/chitin deacetylase (PgdA/CDA1 family)